MQNESSITNSIRIKCLYLPALLYLIFVVYGSLVPLNFSPLEIGEAIERFTQIRYLNLSIGSRADWVANALLMIPLTFLLAGSLWRTSKTVNYLTAVLVVLFCASLSIAIEFTQLFFPPRTVSQNDIFAETLGGSIGVMIWRWVGPLYLNYFLRLNKATGTRSVSEIVLWGYLAVFFGYSLLPLDLTISPVELYHKWVGGKVVILPFSALPNTPAEFMYEVLTDAFVWVPVSMLWILSGRKQRWSAICWVAAAAVVLEFLQLFVFSRVSDITDIFTALFGAVIGAVIAVRVRGDIPVLRTQTHSTRLSQITIGAALFSLWTVLLLLVFWFPYNFNFEGSFLRQRVDGFSSIPFKSYYYGTEFRAVTELLRRICFFAPLGATLFFGKPMSLSNNVSRIYTTCAILIILSVATLVELGQTALPDKFPNNTDLLLQFLGGSFGYFGAEFIRNRIKKIKNSTR